ncbi:hypothetical protein KXD96_06415 [Mycobacterium sp. SMC-2]|uniref:hypothetical protein n=1 Tax=Mycobacterium sp. SMC-2 TaxID=2857058 RepID=UPI0021B3CF83|nr:hypothetical protein [Mycobacterium sp. SMC-2]UXA07745.1 hypothetical protein KXD96_06415 [Mycobacterium sp. SMC-2]
MRIVASVLRAVLWLATTVALAVAIPAAWLQLNVVSEGGYAALAQKAAGDPALQAAAADELTDRAMALIAEHNGGRRPVEGAELHLAAVAFTTGPAFPPMFAEANRAAHRWLFTAGGAGGSWAIDVAPMLEDGSIQRILSAHNVKVPATLMVPLTASAPSANGSLRPGRLSPLSTWGPWVSIGAVVLSGACAVLVLAAAHRRGKALSSLGVSALLVGAGGWAGIEIAGRYVNDALNRTTGGIRRIAEVMVGRAEEGLHQWLNLTLLAGAALAIAGVLAALLGSLWKRSAG